MLNKWRTVESLDDGVISYECLSCYSRWTSTVSPEHGGWVFCPFCGTIWEGEHKCNEHGHKLYEYQGKMTESQMKNQSNIRRSNDIKWELQYRIINENGEVIQNWEWHNDFVDYPVELYKDETELRQLRFAAYNLKRVKELNKASQKDVFGCIKEYRLARMRPVKSNNWYDYNKKEAVKVVS